MKHVGISVCPWEQGYRLLSWVVSHLVTWIFPEFDVKLTRQCMPHQESHAAVGVALLSPDLSHLGAPEAGSYKENQSRYSRCRNSVGI